MQKLNSVCIYGIGAIGGWIGARLAAAGCQVSAVSRGPTLDALRTHGLRLDTEQGRTVYPVRASDDPAQLGAHDLIVLAVKAPAMLEVARRIAPLLKSDTIVLTAMNGLPWWFLNDFGGAYANRRVAAVDATGEIGAAILPQYVVGGVVHASCSLLQPGHARHHFGNGLIIGEPAGGVSARVQALSDLLVRAGFACTVSEQIQYDTWYKLWGNMTINPISALTGATADLIMDDDLVRGFASRVMWEAKEIGARLGLPIAQEPDDRHAVTRKLGAFKTSMLQDVEGGRQVELDALVTAVKELGTLTGVATPNTDALLGLARLHARVRKLY